MRQGWLILTCENLQEQKSTNVTDNRVSQNPQAEGCKRKSRNGKRIAETSSG